MNIFEQAEALGLKPMVHKPVHVNLNPIRFYDDRPSPERAEKRHTIIS